MEEEEERENKGGRKGRGREKKVGRRRSREHPPKLWEEGDSNSVVVWT